MIYQAESGFWFKLAEGNLGKAGIRPDFVFAEQDGQAAPVLLENFGPVTRRETMRQLYSS